MNAKHQERSTFANPQESIAIKERKRKGQGTYGLCFSHETSQDFSSKLREVISSFEI
jgi:hypothetical protein